MTYSLKTILGSSLLLASAALANAQGRDELSFGIGATVTPQQSVRAPGQSPISFDPSFAFTADYYHRLAGNDRFALSGGISLAASPLDVKANSGPPNAISQYAYFFLTPELRLKLKPQSVISPWLSVGGGYARFSEGALLNGVRNPDVGTNRGTFQFGGGVDVRTPFVTPFFFHIPLGLRLEVRDYYSGKPRYLVPTSDSLQHNVLFAAGIVLNFR